jgi:glycine cleavage system H protein
MSSVVPGLRYTKDDEWLRLGVDIAVIDISDYAQGSLSDIVYLELPEVGTSVNQGDVFGAVESAKAAADLLAPVAGEITAANAEEETCQNKSMFLIY